MNDWNWKEKDIKNDTKENGWRWSSPSKRRTKTKTTSNITIFNKMINGFPMFMAIVYIISVFLLWQFYF